MHLTRIPTCLCLAACVAATSSAQIVRIAPQQLMPRAPGCPEAPEATLTSPTGVAQDAFGYDAMEIDGRIFVGQRGDDTLGLNVGSVRIYHETPQGWQEEAVLTSGLVNQQFGWSLAAHAGRLVVGAPGSGDGLTPGTVHVFEEIEGTWVPTDVLTGNPGKRSGFGMAVAIEGDTLIVGSPLEDTPASSAGGVVYVFEHDGNNWTEVAQLTGAVVNGGALGVSVDIEGDVLIAGAPYIANEWIFGKAFVFRRTQGTWQLEQELTHTLPGGRDRFGAAVALHQGRAWVGSPRDLPPNIGAVISFDFDQESGFWSAEQTLLAPDYEAFDRFGSSLSLDGPHLVVGAPTWGLLGRGATGRVYLFDVAGARATFRCAFPPPAPAPQELFGNKVFLQGNRVLIGSPYDNVVNVDDGSLSIYTLTPGMTTRRR